MFKNNFITTIISLLGIITLTISVAISPWFIIAFMADVITFAEYNQILNKKNKTEYN